MPWKETEAAKGPLDVKYSVLLENNHCFSKLVIMDDHARITHSGTTKTINIFGYLKKYFQSLR